MILVIFADGYMAHARAVADFQVCGRWPFGLRKTAFCTVKDDLLEGGKPPFARRFVSCCFSVSCIIAKNWGHARLADVSGVKIFIV